VAPGDGLGAFHRDAVGGRQASRFRRWACAKPSRSGIMFGSRNSDIMRIMSSGFMP
jgi:hypothetical protein